MNKYAEVALRALEILNRKEIPPEKAWKEAALEVFRNSESSRDKSCPQNAFLGLCEEGLVKGITPGNYTKSRDNKNYAIQALKVLRKSGDINEKELWRIIDKGDSEKRHNQ